ncbi:stage II sporulation protein M [Natronobeatus ordinarius]|uniref:stage II sporulation protein M n=1 Tax=Natronobeatus ordinarius TaxID=2963433 RepID=UPI0020CD5826|nr:stage II sporulation protein M [Natronobeatus ordinarius]
MRLSTAVRVVVATLRKRPSDLLPFYVLGAAVPAITRVVPFLAFVVAYLALETTGRLEVIWTELATLEEPPADPEADPEAFEQWSEAFATAIEPAFSPAEFGLFLVGLVVLTLVVTILLSVLLYALVSAGQVATCYARLRDERGLPAGVEGVRRYWLSFLGLFLLEFFFWMTAAAVVGTITAMLVVVAISAGVGALGVLFALFGLLTWLALGAVIRALFAFTPVAVVVDDVSALRSVRASAGFLRRQPVEAIFYYAVAIVALFGIGFLTSILSVVGAPSLVALLSVFVVLPALDLLKTTLFGGYRRSISPPPAPDRSLRSQFSGGIRRGWSELLAFVRETPGIHAVVIAISLGSFWVGWIAAAPFVDAGFEASILARLEGVVPPIFALELFGNNWTVAFTTAFAGLALAIPALASLAFNGFVFGIYARLEVDPDALLAFVAPHGLFEIPAILVAGALGISLGLAWWRAVRGQLTRTELANDLERAFWVVVGLGVVLAVAALLEGFVSPYYFRLFL